jgi:hypothetical protein
LAIAWRDISNDFIRSEIVRTIGELNRHRQINGYDKRDKYFLDAFMVDCLYDIYVFFSALLGLISPKRQKSGTQVGYPFYWILQIFMTSRRNYIIRQFLFAWRSLTHWYFFLMKTNVSTIIKEGVVWLKRKVTRLKGSLCMCATIFFSRN